MSCHSSAVMSLQLFPLQKEQKVRSAGHLDKFIRQLYCGHSGGQRFSPESPACDTDAQGSALVWPKLGSLKTRYLTPGNPDFAFPPLSCSDLPGVGHAQLRKVSPVTGFQTKPKTTSRLQTRPHAWDSSKTRQILNSFLSRCTAAAFYWCFADSLCKERSLDIISLFRKVLSKNGSLIQG